MPEPHIKNLILSYHRVRQTLGLMGLTLPIMLSIGGFLSGSAIEPSISDFYHTGMRNLFVGALTPIGIFLISYKGWKGLGKITMVAGLAAIGVAFFPNEGPDVLLREAGQSRAVAIMHYVSALTFFICLGLFCFVVFPSDATRAQRRAFFRCGYAILLSTVLVTICSYFKVQGPVGPQTLVMEANLVFWFESIGVWGFAVAWLLKGHHDLQRSFPEVAEAAYLPRMCRSLGQLAVIGILILRHVLWVVPLRRTRRVIAAYATRRAHLDTRPRPTRTWRARAAIALDRIDRRQTPGRIARTLLPITAPRPRRIAVQYPRPVGPSPKPSPRKSLSTLLGATYWPGTPPIPWQDDGVDAPPPVMTSCRPRPSHSFCPHGTTDLSNPAHR